MTDLWDGLTRDLDGEEDRERLLAAKVAFAPSWAFVVEAQSPQELEDRLTLSDGALTRAVASVAPVGTPAHTMTRLALVQEVEADWRAMHVGAHGDELDDLFGSEDDGGTGWPGAYDDGYVDGYGSPGASTSSSSGNAQYDRGLRDGQADARAHKKPKIAEAFLRHHADEALPVDECLNYDPATCKGPVEYRPSLSPSGKSFPRCDYHWGERLKEQDRINATYPQQAPSDFDPGYAGETWDEDPGVGGSYWSSRHALNDADIYTQEMADASTIGASGLCIACEEPLDPYDPKWGRTPEQADRLFALYGPPAPHEPYHQSCLNETFGLTGVRRTAEEHAPYHIEPKDKDAAGPFKVVNDKGDVKGTHDTWDQARSQQKALYKNVPGAAESAEKKSSSRRVATPRDSNLRGVADILREGNGVDQSFADLTNEALRVCYPNVIFEDRMGAEYNRLVNGNGFVDVSDQIPYEFFWSSSEDQLQAIIDGVVTEKKGVTYFDNGPADPDQEIARGVEVKPPLPPPPPVVDDVVDVPDGFDEDGNFDLLRAIGPTPGLTVGRRGVPLSERAIPGGSMSMGSVAHSIVASDQVVVLNYPACDFCGAEAHYDAKTDMGPWAYMCDTHMAQHGLPLSSLGTGVGQRLVVESVRSAR